MKPSLSTLCKYTVAYQKVNSNSLFWLIFYFPGANPRDHHIFSHNAKILKLSWCLENLLIGFSDRNIYPCFIMMNKILLYMWHLTGCSGITPVMLSICYAAIMHTHSLRHIVTLSFPASSRPYPLSRVRSPNSMFSLSKVVTQYD